MDHKDLVAIKLRRGFVESPTGGFVRSTNWQAVRLARMARTHQELTGRVEKLAAELGLAAKSVPPPPSPLPEILSWPQRLILLVRISWCLLRQGSKSAIRDILDGPNG